MKCPREYPQNLKQGDIFEIKCPECGSVVEFWKGDLSAKCPKCQVKVENPCRCD